MLKNLMQSADKIVLDLLGVSGTHGPLHPDVTNPRNSRESLASNASDGQMTLFHPFSSDKIRAKILDLGYGGARRALHNLCPKSARILSAAITTDRWTDELTYNLAPRRG